MEQHHEGEPSGSGCPFHRGNPPSDGASEEPDPLLDEALQDLEMSEPGGARRESESLLRFSPLGQLRKLLRFSRDEGIAGIAKLVRGEPEHIGYIDFARIALTNFNDPCKIFGEIHRRHGDVVEATLPNGDHFVFLQHPDSLNHILMNTDKNSESPFEKSELYAGGIGRLIGHENIFLGRDDLWKHRRVAMRASFHPRALTEVESFQRTSDTIERFIEDWKQRAAASPDGWLRGDMQEELPAMTLAVALQTLFSKDVSLERLRGELVPAFRRVFQHMFLETLNPLTISVSDLTAHVPGLGSLKESYEVLDAFAREVIEERDGVDKGDLLDAIKEAGHHSREGDLSEEELRNEFLTVLLAGHETSSTLMTWALHYLSRDNPSLQRLQEEIDSVFQRDIPELDSMRGTRGLFLDCVTEEAGRLSTPLYFLVRRVKRDTLIPVGEKAIPVEKGTTLVLSPFHAHRRVEQWGEEKTGYPADEFHPERWTEENKQKFDLGSKELRNFVFGRGARMCIGAYMGKLETRMILTRLFQEFDLEFEPNSGRSTSDTTVKLKDGLRMRLKVRPDPARGCPVGEQ